MEPRELVKTFHGQRMPRSRFEDPPVHPPTSRYQFGDVQVYPATTKWNIGEEESSGRYTKHVSSTTDPRPVIRSSKFPTDTDRQWYSAAIRSTQTRGVCWWPRGNRHVNYEDLPTLEDVCFVCKIDLETDPRDRTSYPFSTWNQSASHGCQNCDQISRAVRMFAGTYSLEVNDLHVATLDVRYMRNDISRRCQKILVGVFWVSTAGDMSEHLEFERSSQASPSAPAGEPPLRCFSEAGVQDIFLAAQKLVRTCNNSHGCLPSSPDFLPTRLLDIQCSPCECIKMIETSNLSLGTATQYIALSYCWGDSNPLRLRRSTLQSMRNRIGWETLPRLFQDVVRLARLLEIRYIWIDALCIVQDDKQDWEKESLLMGKIYRNAYLVVGATSCNNSSESLVAKSFKNIPISIEYDSSDFSAVSCSTVGGNITWPLHSRGWTYQEIILANRFLDFDSNGLQLHCQKGTLHAVDVMDDVSGDKPPNVIPADSNPPKYRQGRSTDFRQPWSFRYFWSQFLSQDQTTTTTSNSGIIVDADGKEISIHEVWQEVVMMYTNRRLSYVSDLLPALSGIASEYLDKAATGEKYVAGLWRSSFVQNLTWAANHEAVPSDAYQAPSWSWASIRGSVDYDYTARADYGNMTSLGEQRTRLVDVFSETKGANPLGEATSGFALLEGPVFTCLLKRGHSWYNIQPQKASNWSRIQFRSDVVIQAVRYSDDRGETRYSAQRVTGGAGISLVAEGCDYEVLALHLFDLDDRNGLYLVLGMASPKGLEYQRLGLLEAESSEFYGSVDFEPDFSSATIQQVRII